MVVTDGSPETYQEIFEKYNAPNHEVMRWILRCWTGPRYAYVTLDCFNRFSRSYCNCTEYGRLLTTYCRPSVSPSLIHDLFFLHNSTTEHRVSNQSRNSLSHSRLACSRLSGHIQPSVNNSDTDGAANLLNSQKHRECEQTNKLQLKRSWIKLVRPLSTVDNTLRSCIPQ